MRLNLIMRFNLIISVTGGLFMALSVFSESPFDFKTNRKPAALK